MPTQLIERTDVSRTYRSESGRSITVPNRKPRRLPARLLPFGAEPVRPPRVIPAPKTTDG